MNTQELHQRILLHELRTILLDPTREGSQIPEDFAHSIQQDPHSDIPYLVLADWLDEQGDELGELCRIQCELIGMLPVDYSMKGPLAEPRSSQHSFEKDYGTALVTSHRIKWPEKLLLRRWEITKELYNGKTCHIPKEIIKWDMPAKDWMEIIQPHLIEAGFELPGEIIVPTEDTNEDFVTYTQPRRKQLGRTTRMLTDALRYCVMNENQITQIIVPSLIASHFMKLSHLYVELTDEEPLKRDYVGNPVWPVDAWNNQITISTPDTYQDANITFTDHAVNSWPQGTATNDEYDFFSPLIVNRYLEEQARETLRDRRTLDALRAHGTIQYLPPGFNSTAFIKPD